MSSIDIALGFDTQYAPHAGVVIASVMRHAPGASIRFICLHDGVSLALRAKVEACAPTARFHWAEVREGDLPAFATRGHFNRAILFRIGLEKLAPPDCQRVLYLDSDVVVCDDVRALWASALGDCAIGAVGDCYQDGVEFSRTWSLPTSAPRYFNSGMLLIDLERVRADGLFTAASEFVARHGEQILFGDQDALNFVFWDRWRQLDSAWNVQRYLNADDAARAGWRTPSLIHFIGTEKPWTPGAWHPWAWLYWENLARTPFFEDVASSNRMDLYQRLRLRFRWWLKRPDGGLLR